MSLDKLVVKYKDFVEKYAKRIYEKEKFPLMPLEDITQCAYIGLIRAYNRYEKDKYTEQQFKTYVEFFMYQEIDKEYHDFINSVHLPENYIRDIRKIKRLLDLDEDKNIEKLAEKMDYPADRIRKALYISYMFDNLFSYKDEYGNDINIPMLVRDIKYDGDYNFDDDKLENKILYEKIIKEIFYSDILTKRQKEVLYLRYGFGEREPLTQGEVAKMYNLTRTRIYQIESRIFLKLRKYLGKKGYRYDLFY